MMINLFAAKAILYKASSAQASWEQIHDASQHVSQAESLYGNISSGFLEHGRQDVRNAIGLVRNDLDWCAQELDLLVEEINEQPEDEGIADVDVED